MQDISDMFNVLESRYLTEGVDTPNNTLHEDLVLVQSNESTYIQHQHRQHESTKTGIPSVAGVKSGNMILLLGLLPSNTLLLINASVALAPTSLRTSSSVFPNASASGCAKKFERRMRWCLEWWIGLCVVAGARKSAGMSLVPWCTSW